MEEHSVHVIECKLPGLSCCPYRLTATNVPANNVWRRKVYCGRWRENRCKDAVFRACDENYYTPKA